MQLIWWHACTLFIKPRLSVSPFLHVYTLIHDERSPMRLLKQTYEYSYVVTTTITIFGLANLMLLDYVNLFTLANRHQYEYDKQHASVYQCEYNFPHLQG